MIKLFTTIGGLFGASGRVASFLGATVLIVGIFGALFTAKAIYDHSVIANHNAKQDAANSKADRAADGNVAVDRRIDDQRLGNEAVQLEKVNDNALSDRDRRVARQRCIRLQQSARAAGSIAPAC